jgi:hypothetical protein
MVETAVLALASAGGGSAVYAGFGAGAALSTGATLSTISAGSLLATGVTAASAFGSIMGGQQQAAVSKSQAKQYELSARAEELKGRDQANRIRESLRSTIASQNAAFASRGIQLGTGTPLALGNVSRNEASRDLQTAQFGSGMAAEAARGTAAQSRATASAQSIKGYADAASSIGGSLIK